jgi:hypothetical protein
MAEPDRACLAIPGNSRRDCQPARDVDPRSAPNIDPAMASLMMEPRNAGMGVRRRRV